MSHRELPEKTCRVCGLPFAWRKKWEDCWDEVKYCSERCRRNRDEAAPKTSSSAEWERDEEGFWIPPDQTR